MNIATKKAYALVNSEASANWELQVIGATLFLITFPILALLA